MGNIPAGVVGGRGGWGGTGSVEEPHAEHAHRSVPATDQVHYRRLLSLGKLGIPKGVFDATTTPGINNDIRFGFGRGSWWMDTTTGKLYLCTDPTTGAAVWVEASVATHSHAHSALSGLTADDHTQYVLRSILTTRGDLFTRDASAIIRLGIGANTRILGSDGTDAAWKAQTFIDHGSISGLGDDDHTIYALDSDLHAAQHGKSAHTEHANWKALYTDGSGDEQELALGAAATFYRSAGASSAPTMSAIVTGDLPSRTATITLWAGAGTPTTTSGCAARVQNETTTNKINYWSLDFDQTSTELAFWTGVMPDGWDGGTVTFRVHWTATGGSGGVVWTLDGRSFGDDDALDQAVGTAVSSTDTFITAGDEHISPVSAAVTLAGTPAGGEKVFFRVSRSTVSGSDTLTADAKLIAVVVEYTQASTD